MNWNKMFCCEATCTGHNYKKGATKRLNTHQKSNNIIDTKKQQTQLRDQSLYMAEGKGGEVLGIAWFSGGTDKG